VIAQAKSQAMDDPVSFYDAWLFCLTCTAAFTDARSGVIPNWLTLPTVMLAPVAHALLSGPGALAWSLAGAVVCAAVPFTLFVHGAIGGGDVKLFAAAGALVGAHAGLELQVVTYVLAALGAMAWLAYRGQLRAVLRRALARLARSALPRTAGMVPAADPAFSVRLGIAAFAACLVLAARGLPELQP
jgi:prepilin peptidase CpaA